MLLLVVSAHGAPLTTTPFGDLPAECVHSVPSGTHLERQLDGRVLAMHPTFTQPRVLPRCKRAPVRAARGFPSDYNGWLAYTAYQTQAPLATFDAFLGNFSVPNEPARKPRVLYIFTGLQNINWVPKVDPNPSGPFDIIQVGRLGIAARHLTLRHSPCCSTPRMTRLGGA